jgi:hypothetical protein
MSFTDICSAMRLVGDFTFTNQERRAWILPAAFFPMGPEVLPKTSSSNWVNFSGDICTCCIIQPGMTTERPAP